MPLTKISTNSVEDDAITSPKIADNPSFSGTSGVKLPEGTTAQRVNTNALLRYNTQLNLPEYFNGTDYVVIDSPPSIISVNNTNPTETQIAAGFDLVITGNGFKAGASVSFIGQNGTPLASPTVTINSSTQITARLPNTVTAAQEPFDVRVTNATGLAATKENAFNVNSTPSWTTASGLLATIYDNATGNHATVAATDPDGDAITFSWAGAGGLSLDQNTGVISGNPTDVTSSTTLTFTITATDSVGNSVGRSFSIVVNPYLDGSSASRAATSAKAIKTLTGTTTSGLYWLKPSGFSHPAQFYCEMNYYGGGWTFVIQRQVVYGGGTATSNYLSLNSYTGTQNRHSSNFSGVKDNQNNTYTIQDIWDGIVGSSNNAAVYCEELQTTGGSYHERQAYTSSTDGPQFSYTDFIKFFNSGDGPTGIKVSFNNGSSSVTNKQGKTWGNLQTINNGQVDQELYFCNGNGNDSNWSFGLMRGGTPYPRTANSSNGGGRNGTIRWAIWAIRE